MSSNSHALVTPQALAHARARYESERNPKVRLPAWLRWAAYQRLADAQHNGLHWWHQVTPTHAVCTCGLQTPTPTPPVAEVRGHRDPRSGQSTPTFVTHSPASRFSYRALCQVCGWLVEGQDLGPLQADVARHIHLATDEVSP